MLIASEQLFAQNPVATASVTPASSGPPVAQSGSALDSKVDYSANDSIRFDVANQKMYLFGQAQVKYEDMVLKAEYIEFDMIKNIAYSRGGRDSLGRALMDTLGLPVGDPQFSDGGKSFDAKELTYNFRTQKGKIREVTTKEGEAYIHAIDAKKDSGDVYYIKNGRYTTCNLPHPHFYLQATKIKIIPDDKIIIGPAYLAVADVPTPLGLPFGVFPNKTGRKSGVLIPAYGESELGFFLKEGGYYFGFSDYFDLALRGDLYSKGSYGLKTNTNYAKRYKFTGFVGLSFAQIQVSEPGFSDYTNSKDFFVRWNHTQDPKANPTSRFSANVNAGSSTYQTYNSNTANDYLASTLLSNISWNKSWQGRPYNLSMSMAHTQNTKLKTVDVTLPEVAFTRNRFYPLQRKNQIGKPNVFQKIGTSFSLNAKNQVSTYDSLIFEPKSLKFQKNLSERFRNGLKASIPINTSMNVGPFIITPSFVFNSYGYFQSYNKRYINDTVITDSLITDTIKGFRFAHDYNKSIAVSTKLYGMCSFKNARVKAIRHVMTPIASLSYRPDFGEPRFNYYELVQLNKIDTTPVLYSHFQNSVYGQPPSGKSGFLNLAVNNNLEMKLRPSKKDSSGLDRKVILIENFGISSAYNIAAERFKWSNTNIFARTRLFKIVDILINATIDPYVYDTALGKRLDSFHFTKYKKIGRLTNAVFSLNTSLRSLVKKDAKSKIPVRRMVGYEDELAYIQAHPEYYVDFNVPWDLSVYYNVVYSKLYGKSLIQDTIIQSLTFNGNLSVTDKWKVGIRSGFDFVNKDFTYTAFDIYRDLHCWEMRLNWIPFGLRKSYMVTIAVKASVLQDLKLNRTRNWYDYN